MTREHAIDRLNRLSTLLDRARDMARTDTRELNALLDEAAVTLEAVAPTLEQAAASKAPDPALTAAARRARASHTALHRALRDELTLIGKQLAHTNAGADAALRYIAPTGPGQRLDRLG